MYRIISIANNHKLAMYLTLGFSAIVFYDIVWDLLMSLIHSVFVALHYVFETCEHLLELSIEHLFHTTPRNAEIIVFYIFAGIVFFLTYILFRKIPGWYCGFCQHLKTYYQEQKTNFMHWWQQNTFMIKTKWCALMVVSFTVLTLVTIS